MQPRQSTQTGALVSQSNQGDIGLSVLLMNESGIMHKKHCSVSRRHESEVQKIPTLTNKKQDDMNQKRRPNKINDSDNYGERKILESGSHASESNQVSLELKKELIHDGGVHASVSTEKQISENGNPASQLKQMYVLPKKELDNLEQNLSPDARVHRETSGEKQVSESWIHMSQFSQISVITKMDPDSLEHGQSPDSRNDTSAPYDRGGTDFILLEKSLQHMQSTNLQACTTSFNQEKMTCSSGPEKTLYKLQPRRNPDSGFQASQSEQGNNSPVICEQALHDGYNWRKYGQKLVKGNVLVRSYYKCTYFNCRAKKQVERSHEGHLTDIKYIGDHEHPKPQSSLQVTAVVSPPEVSKADMFVTAISKAQIEPSAAPEDVSQPNEPTESPEESIATASSHSIGGAVVHLDNQRDDIDKDINPSSKRQKKETSIVDDNQAKKTRCESRKVVQMMSEVDKVSDGYRWRKYGQKLVKGNPNPRSYYRCSNAGCTVKKHVERASYDPKVVIATYEGKHDHDMPASRNISNSEVESIINRSTMNGEARSDLEEHKPVGMDIIVNISAN